MRELEKQYKALANRRRLEILNYLQKTGQATVSGISDHLRLTIKATSKHLTQLLGVEAVSRDQKGFYMVYKISEHLTPSVKFALQQLKS